jgi:hypothetical protein
MEIVGVPVVTGAAGVVDGAAVAEGGFGDVLAGLVAAAAAQAQAQLAPLPASLPEQQLTVTLPDAADAGALPVAEGWAGSRPVRGAASPQLGDQQPGDQAGERGVEGKAGSAASHAAERALSVAAPWSAVAVAAAARATQDDAGASDEPQPALPVGGQPLGEATRNATERARRGPLSSQPPAVVDTEVVGDLAEQSEPEDIVRPVEAPRVAPSMERVDAEPTGAQPAPSLESPDTQDGVEQPVPSSALRRVLDAVEALQHRPPPRSMAIEIAADGPGEEALQLLVTLRGDTVHVTSEREGLPGEWARELADLLSERGMELAGFGSGERGQGRGRRDGRERDSGPDGRPATPSPLVASRADDGALRL